MLHLGTMSPLDKHLAELAENREWRNDEYLRRKDQEAFAQLRPDHVHVPEVIHAGQVTKRQHQFTWDYTWDPMKGDWRAQAEARVRKLREEGKPLTPREIIIFEGSHGEKVYHDEVELEALAQGLFCIRCHNPQPDNPHTHAEAFQRLLNTFTDYVKPDGVKDTDLCCYCGLRLDTQRQEAAA